MIKEKTHFGPWMIISYGKHENRNNGNRFGNNGSFVGRATGGGKQFGSGTAGKSAGVPTDSIQGKANKDVNPDVVKKANTSKVGGSRFEILSEEMDVTMNENIGQPKMSSDGGSKINEQGILAEITNQTEKHGEESIMISHSSENRAYKKITSKKTIKIIDKGGQLKVGSLYLRNPRSKGKKQTPKSTHTENHEDGIMDSAMKRKDEIKWLGVIVDEQPPLAGDDEQAPEEKGEEKIAAGYEQASGSSSGKRSGGDGQASGGGNEKRRRLRKEEIKVELGIIVDEQPPLVDGDEQALKEKGEEKITADDE
ncbi:hypothetical protein Q3G72_013049 [Acer saccharum]|nr:hypothetical protein Q3G72_013049 [Acer saccharum]